jgi:hypothetical protein
VCAPAGELADLSRDIVRSAVDARDGTDPLRGRQLPRIEVDGDDPLAPFSTQLVNR